MEGKEKKEKNPLVVDYPYHHPITAVICDGGCIYDI